MRKYQNSTLQGSRKRKKGGTTYGPISGDPVIGEKTGVEDVRVLDVSTSKRTGRISGVRRVVKYHHPTVDPSEEPLATNQQPENEQADADDEGNLADSESPPDRNNKRPKRRHPNAPKENDSTKVEQWIHDRPRFLDEVLRHDGLGNALNGPMLCSDCSTSPAQYKCKDCLSRGIMRCSSCALSSHRDLPLHRLQAWNGRFFESATLESLGLVVNFGHNDDDVCLVNPETRLITVVDLSGYHPVRVRFCMCSRNSFLEPFCQLLRMCWYPASRSRPGTAFTFELLDTYHKISLQGKLNLYDFYNSIMQKTDNRGSLSVKYRYHEMSRCFRQWRHIKDMKRGGAGHSPVEIDDLEDGVLAIECPACPHPDRNLPEDWENVAADRAWLYSLFLAMDANFRLKLKSRDIKDPELGFGLAYFINTGKFETLFRDLIEEGDIETCGAEFHAVNQANSKRSKVFSVSGVAAVVCRHGLIRKNGVIDLPKGEKFNRVDYIFIRTVKDEKVKIIKVSYDIVCRWSKKLFRRMLDYPEDLRIPEEQFKLEYFIPKFHLPAHGSSCHTKYSFNYRPGVGRTHGENIESGWAHTNPAATSTREMGAGARHSTLDGHWGGWNWRKIIGFGPLLLKNLHEAVDMAKRCRDACKELEQNLSPGVVHGWESMKRSWELDSSKPDPYKITEQASSFSAVKLKLSEAEGRDSELNASLPHTLSPFSFVRMGLEIEDQQQQVIAHLESKEQRTDLQKMELQERRNTLIRRIKMWRTAQAVYMPQVSKYLANELPNPDDEPDESKPEVWPLFLPSKIPQGDRSLCHEGIIETEHILRLAQLQDNLVDLRRFRRSLLSLRTYFKSNVVGEGQKAQTKARSAESRATIRVSRAVLRYRLAHSALLSLDPQGDWSKEYLALTQEDNRGPGKEIWEQGVGDGRYFPSWIWRGSPGAQCSPNPSEQEVNEAIRHEWMTCGARADRWEEERDLLQEEMRRTIAFLEWKSVWWSRKVGSRSGAITADIQHGIDSYAHKQANTYHELAVSLTNQWLTHLPGLNLDVSWAKAYPWAAGMFPGAEQSQSSAGSQETASPDDRDSNAPSDSQRDVVPGATRSSGDEYDHGDNDDESPQGDGEYGHHDEGEDSDGLGMGFEYDDGYMC